MTKSHFLPFAASLTLAALLLTARTASAAPALTTPTTENLGANQVTLVLQSSDTGSGYFTLLLGSGAASGTGTQVKAGQDSTGATAPYQGSLSLTANTAGRYTVRNLTENTSYTVCFTADSPSGANMQATPVTASFTTAAATAFSTPGWGVVGSAGFSFAPPGLVLLRPSHPTVETVGYFRPSLPGRSGVSAERRRSLPQSQSLLLTPRLEPEKARHHAARGPRNTATWWRRTRFGNRSVGACCL